MANIVETIANKIEKILVTRGTDHQGIIGIYFLFVAVLVYGLWSGLGLLMPDFYYDQPKERLLLTFIGFLLVIYLASSRGHSKKKNSVFLFLYLFVLNLHFLSLFVRAGGDEIYALGLLVFLIGASLLFLDFRHYISFFIFVIASYVPTFVFLNLPSYRIVMLIAGMLTICVATSLLVFLRMILFDRFHTQQIAIADLERKLTEEKFLQQEEESKYYKNIAYYDSLTGLPSRRSLEEHLHRKFHNANQKQGRFAVLFADLDDFKKVNDKHGHDSGDSVLQEFAERLKIALRSSDYVARYGGDEFVCIISGVCGIFDLKPICDRILEDASAPYRLEPDTTLTVSVSIGIALHPGEDNATCSPEFSSPQDLLKLADRAMYEGKQRGKNRWFAYEEQG